MGLAGDMAQIATIRSVLGPEVKIRIDANAAWSVSEAIDRLKAMSSHTVELAEEPVAGLEQLAEVRAHTRIPLAADESVPGQRDARRAVELDACSLATVKLAKVGGIAEALEIAAILPVYMSSALEGPVGITAAAHCVQALPSQPAAAGLAHGLATERLFSETVGRGAEASGDTLRLGDEPGLGVEVDLEALESRRLS
jgi:O-succinylbenzoate synthase